jgi:hypothetical protein
LQKMLCGNHLYLVHTRQIGMLPLIIIIKIKRKKKKKKEEEEGKMGYGGIVRDFQGSVQATFYLQVNILAEPVVGEVWRRSKWLNLA